MAVRPKPYSLEWPVTAENFANIDEMFQILFEDLRNGALTIDSTQITDFTEAVTKLLNFSPRINTFILGSGESSAEDHEEGWWPAASNVAAKGITQAQIFTRIMLRN